MRVAGAFKDLLSGATLAGALLISGGLVAQEATTSADPELAKRIEFGRAVLEDRKKGNCLSCHLIIGAELPGNAGPPLISMKARWPDREALKQQIYDPTIANPDTIMPPYGKHRMLTDEELEALVDFVHSL